ncbi:cation transporter [Mycolicibacterium vaccae]|uniref:Integral membrane protein n=1 Tax=Mycolicibacterium vaccae ATCC 25954 TaxID=1194972 RepID=K0V1F2_MYCVA|nr:cation transporter [Mycolicibacterium vaccae]EJZ11170.1 integral membrane protein [Mycolicibacterium vaccae ATCC 25954]
MSAPAESRRVVLARRIRWFVAATITYNVIEAAVALLEGARVSSTALIGFGLDSVIEVSSAAAVAWQFAGRDPEAREKAALRVIAFSFFALAAYVTVDAVRSLLGAGEPQPSAIGIALASVSLVIMPVLSYAQRRAGRELGSLSAVADSKQTLLCTYLSAVLLIGLVLNSAFGWSWADPAAGLVIAAVAVREGREAWKGRACCGHC